MHVLALVGGGVAIAVTAIAVAELVTRAVEQLLLHVWPISRRDGPEP